ncbi:50S ribosomal protein L10 [Candidatus Magnetomorum sp. HK-1]|nr:50S ribosomal protein L10 [Candidatus Magnetomorum sp. HK-1]
MNLEKKQRIVEDIHKRFQEAEIVITTDYKGLDVEELTDLRRQLREASIEYQVVKNTLLSRASENTDISVLKDYFKGPCAIAISYDDPVAPAKILNKFSETHPKLELKVGAMSGNILSLDELKALSKLPSREQLLSQLLSCMNAVPGNFVRTLAAVPGGFVNVLQGIKDKKEQESA